MLKKYSVAFDTYTSLKNTINNEEFNSLLINHYVKKENLLIFIEIPIECIYKVNDFLQKNIFYEEFIITEVDTYFTNSKFFESYFIKNEEINLLESFSDILKITPTQTQDDITIEN